MQISLNFMRILGCSVPIQRMKLPLRPSPCTNLRVSIQNPRISMKFSLGGYGKNG
jgi:hypothetical protein